MSLLLRLGLVMVVVMASGIAHGLWSGRWNVSDGPQRAAARLERLPMAVGDWDGRAGELDARQMKVAELSGARVCEYVNRRTGSVVSTLLVCGRPGPVSVHTPEICYVGRGYALAGARSRYGNPTLPGAELWVCDFQKPQTAIPDRLRIFYAWTANGRLSAPDHPRLTFFREPALYKLYVSRKLVQAEEPLEDDPAVDFLKVFVPQLQKSVFAMP
ncbi:MAG TPA: exosortase-associated EpsI family protein [Gemmataceae bacterium]|nr:exosortase-associated EpsI family protein [Gemmataceae bacterium]